VLVGILVGIRFEQIGGMEEGALLHPNIDKRSLNTWKYRLYAPEVDVTDSTPLIGSVDQQLDELVVLEDGHAGLAWCARDENLAFHRGLAPGCGTLVMHQPDS
jgi:hypothetical protein